MPELTGEIPPIIIVTMRILIRFSLLSTTLILCGLASSGSATADDMGTCYRYCERGEESGSGIGFQPDSSTYEDCCEALEWVACPTGTTPGAFWIGGNPATTESC